MIKIEEGEETQVKGTENIFNGIIEDIFPNLKRRHLPRSKYTKQEVNWTRKNTLYDT